MLKNRYEGKAWKFGDNISTDAIAPGRLLHLRSHPEEYAKFVLCEVAPNFSKEVAAEDFIVAGDNFGCGSSREIAVLIIKIAGVAAVVARSFGRIFYRNAINNGLLMIHAETDGIAQGDDLVLELERGVIRKRSDPDFSLHFQLGSIEKEILKEGGLLNYLDKHHSLNRF